MLKKQSQPDNVDFDPSINRQFKALPPCPIHNPQTKYEIKKMIIWKVTLGAYDKRKASPKRYKDYLEWRKMFWEKYEKPEEEKAAAEAAKKAEEEKQEILARKRQLSKKYRAAEGYLRNKRLREKRGETGEIEQ